MEILNESLTHYVNENDSYNQLTESATPMWMTYMDAFNSFLEQSGKRLERYETYEEMDKYPEIHLALDIISTEIFVFDTLTNSPFTFNTNGKIPEVTLSSLIKKFTNTLKLKELLPFAVRQSLKYGDSFYFVVKNKEQHMVGLRRIDNKDIDFVEYNEVGIEPLNYYIAKSKIDESQMGSYLQFLKFQNLETSTANQITTLGDKSGDEFYIIPALSMIRFMNKGQNSQFFPFGESYLESIFPYWKKVSLLEDSLIIYRIVRAPERRVFYIDVGKAPAKIAEKVVSQTKDEIKRRRTAATQENKDLGIASSFNPLSMQEDYFFAQRCISLKNKVFLLDGRTLTLCEIIKEYEEGKQNFVYSVEEKTGKMIPGEIEWAGITRRDAELVKVILDNNEEIICTPDHKFVLRDGSHCEAQYLEGKSLMPLYKKINNYSKNKKGYEMIKDNVQNKWVFTHLEVQPKLIENNVIHHINCDSLNNSPFNLKEMNIDEHEELHRSLGSYHLTNSWKDNEKRNNIIEGMHTYWKNITPDEKLKRNEVSRKNGLQTKINGNISTKEAHLAHTYNINDEICDYFYNFVKDHNPKNLIQTARCLIHDETFFNLFVDCNTHLADYRIKQLSGNERSYTNLVSKLCIKIGFNNLTELKKDLSINNHKCVDVVFLSYREDTGCLTIKDPGNNHNFAVNAGVYIKNSDGRGSRVETLPGACLSLDTKIPLLDGRELELKDIIDEWDNKEKVNWVYSCNPITGELAPGKITWAGVTRKNTKVMKITLDNGETVTCTPDHKFPIRDIGFVEAQDLKEGQSLIPFRKRLKPISKNRNEYEQVFDVSKNEWVFTHRMVDNFFVDNIFEHKIKGVKNVIHHKDYNKFNNAPENLVKMNTKDHFKFHSDNKQYHWDNMTNEERQTMSILMSNGIAEKRKDVEYENSYLKKQTINAIKGNKARLKKQNSDSEFKKKVYKKSGDSLAKRIRDDSVYREKFLSMVLENREPWKNAVTVFDRNMLEMIISIIDESEITHKKTVLNMLTENDEFMNHFQEINQFDGKGTDKRKLDVFGNQHIDKLLHQFNYSGWKDFVSKIPVYNHKIMKIEVLDYGIDVGTITVDGNEEIHNYHTFALSVGIFNKNSNLGEISDVNYFYKKLIAGMRIPGSYFNTESPPTWNDGKVGSALAEEARFGKWLTEIREQYLWDFKALFLVFLKERGVNLQIDDLDMQWKESINVAENQELEKMVQRQSVFTGFPMEQFSPQYLQKKVLGWSEEEIQENMTSLVKWQKYKDNNNLM